MQRRAAVLSHKYEMVDTFQLTPEALGTQRIVAKKFRAVEY